MLSCAQLLILVIDASERLVIAPGLDGMSLRPKDYDGVGEWISFDEHTYFRRSVSDRSAAHSTSLTIS